MTDPKTRKPRNPMSDLTVGKAFDMIRARKADITLREAEHMAKFRTAEKAWIEKTLVRLPQDKRAALIAAIEAAELAEA